MKLNFFVLASFLLIGTLAGTLARAQKQEAIFEVMFNDEKVGVLHAQETKSKSNSFKTLTIETNATFLFIPIHMESEVSTNQKNGILIEGTAYRNASRKSRDVIAKVTKVGFMRYQLERNGVKDKIKNRRIKLCVVDLYFKEPIGVTGVFSNMYGQRLQLKRVSVGKYRLITIDNNDSLFTYTDGKLVSIEVDTPVGKVFSRRI